MVHVSFQSFFFFYLNGNKTVSKKIQSESIVRKQFFQCHRESSVSLCSQHLQIENWTIVQCKQRKLSSCLLLSPSLTVERSRFSLQYCEQSGFIQQIKSNPHSRFKFINQFLTTIIDFLGLGMKCLGIIKALYECHEIKVIYTFDRQTVQDNDTYWRRYKFIQ